MKTALLTVTNQPHRAERLKKSAEKFSWPLHIIETDWYGFGTKLIRVYEWLHNNPSYTHFFFCDAHDVVILGSQEEALSKLNADVITCSAEKGVWPVEEYRKYYNPIHEHGFNFLNSGLYFAPRGKFMALFEENPPNYDTDDQKWFTEAYLFNDASCIELDTDCKVFQSYSFIADDDYEYGDKRVKNLKTGESGVFFHGNGRTNMDLLNKYL